MLLIHILFGILIYPVQKNYWKFYDILFPDKGNILVNKNGDIIGREINPYNGFLIGILILLLAIIGHLIIPIWLIIGIIISQKIGFISFLSDDGFPNKYIPEPYKTLGDIYLFLWWWSVIILGVLGWKSYKKEKERKERTEKERHITYEL